MLNFHSELIFFVDDLWEFAAKSSCRHCNLKKKNLLRSRSSRIISHSRKLSPSLQTLLASPRSA